MRSRRSGSCTWIGDGEAGIRNSGFGTRKRARRGGKGGIVLTNPESPLSADGRLVLPSPDDPAPTVTVGGMLNRYRAETVHEDLDLDVYRGEILGVVGGSGSGKSVLMRSLIGLRQPDEGEISVLGVDPRSDDPRDRVHLERSTGVLFQDGALFSSLTVG